MQPSSQNAFAELQNFQKSRRKSQDVLKESETRLGLPTATQRQQGLRAAITNTENLIRSVDPSVAGRTSGSMVTEAQKTRLVGLERAPLDDSFREQSRAFEGETANVNELKRQALTDAQLGIAEDDSKENSLKGFYDILYRKEIEEAAKAERERAFAEQQRQFNEQLALSKRSAGGGGGGIAGLFGGGSSGNTYSPPTIQDQAYKSVQRFLSQGKSVAESDYQATLKSANNGNAMDKLKIELYRQQGIGQSSGGDTRTGNITVGVARPTQRVVVR